MKKFAILLTLAASFFMFAGCASKTTSDQTMPTDTAPAHKDFKGEKGKTK